MPAEHEGGPGADGESSEEGGEGVGGEPELDHSWQDGEKGDHCSGEGRHRGEDGVADVLHQASCHAGGDTFQVVKVAKALPSNSQALVGHIVQGPEVGRPVGVAEAAFEGEEAGEHVWQLPCLEITLIDNEVELCDYGENELST